MIIAPADSQCASRVPVCAADVWSERGSPGGSIRAGIHGGIKAREIDVEDAWVLGVVSHEKSPMTFSLLDGIRRIAMRSPLAPRRPCVSR
jgi:hypothetical protein